VVTRADLPPAQQAVQGMHAALAFAVAYPETIRAWHNSSQVLVLLSAADKAALEQLHYDLPLWLDVWEFHEPDRDGELTAIAVEPAGADWLSRLPLALRGGDHSDRNGYESAAG
jgi:hypothetical protein